MWTPVLRPTDRCDPTVGCEDHNWSGIALKGSVQEGEALEVEHMRLINEEYTRNDISLSFLTPLSHLDVDLIPDFLLDLTCFS